MYQRRIFSIAFFVVVLDQIAKWFAVKNLEHKSDIKVLGDFFKLSFVRNPGAAFSFATGSTVIFTLVAITVVIVIVRTAHTLTHPWWSACLGALLGGSIGNLLDRLLRSPGFGKGHVVDFIRFPHYPLFNIADIAIVGSAIVMVIMSLRGIEMSMSEKHDS